MQKNSNTLLIIVILVFASILRCWNLGNIPFMYDELSALSRTPFSNFHDLIQLGVIPDFHPAGVQIFLFYWIKIFGTTEWIVKLPFIFFGIMSIYMIYKIGSFWFNPTVGLINAAFMAVMQYMVMYSQIARPYSSGLLFSLLTVWFWSMYIFHQKPYQLKWLVGFVISASLCMYNHYFSFIFAAIVGFTGFVFLKKENRKAYLLSGVAIVALYIPHLSVFFSQLSKGGVGGEGGWLGAPKPNWIFDYLGYAFHFSYAMYALIFTIIIVSLVVFRNKQKDLHVFRIISLAWFIILFCIGFFYSIFVNPVLQFSVLIFVFPFLLLGLTSFMQDLKSSFKIILVTCILFIGTITLAFEREHYTVFYKQPFETQIKQTIQLLNSSEINKSCTIIEMMPPYFKNYYLKKYNHPLQTNSFNPYLPLPDAKDLRLYIQSLKTNYLIACSLPLEFISIIKESYPYMIKKDEGFTFSFYCFSKIKPLNCLHEQVLFEQTNTFKSELPEWNINLSKVFKDSITQQSYMQLDSTIEYGSSFSTRLYSIFNNNNNILLLSATISTQDTSANPVLVCNITNDGENNLLWQGRDYNLFRSNPFSPNTVYLGIDLAGTGIAKYRDAKINVYVWNNGKDKIKIHSITIKSIQGNPYIYGLFEPICK